MISLTATTEGIDALLAGTLQKLNDPTLFEGILDEAQSILLNRVRTRFLAETDPDGVPWIPSKAGLRRKSGKYTYRKGKKYTGTGTLFETGTLFHSIQVFRGAAPFTRVIATDVPYAAWLQDGVSGGPWPFLGFSAEDLTLFEKLVIKRVKEAVS